QKDAALKGKEALSKSRKQAEAGKQERILTAGLLIQRERDRKDLLASLLREKQSLRKKSLISAGKPKVKSVEKIEQIPSVKQKTVPVTKEEAVNIKTHLAALQKESIRIDASSSLQVKESVRFLKKFASDVNKKKIPAVLPTKAIRTTQVVEHHREPFLLVPFLRKNAFKLVSLLLLLIWLAEMFLFYRGLKDASARLRSIVGEEPYSGRQVSEEGQYNEEQMEKTDSDMKKTVFAKEKIDIEGKRDPFSPGRLTMEVLERPTPTSIVLASKPEIVSILRAPKMVSILKEEKSMHPEKVASISKPQTPSVAPVNVAVSAPLKAKPLEKVTAPEITPLILPEMRCDLIYRGRMLFEGVEYLFIEGKQKTYRVTIGDIVEGFRILRRDKNKLYLSRDGVTYEIKID
ncbi:MAG TPA: hypothetical protein PKN36_02455, partial [bacterium]|nr:hypothetical protein [bacterium]